MFLDEIRVYYQTTSNICLKLYYSYIHIILYLLSRRSSTNIWISSAFRFLALCFSSFGIVWSRFHWRLQYNTDMPHCFHRRDKLQLRCKGRRHQRWTKQFCERRQLCARFLMSNIIFLLRCSFRLMYFGSYIISLNS